MLFEESWILGNRLYISVLRSRVVGRGDAFPHQIHDSVVSEFHFRFWRPTVRATGSVSCSLLPAMRVLRVAPQGASDTSRAFNTNQL